jgi:ribonuclease E
MGGEIPPIVAAAVVEPVPVKEQTFGPAGQPTPEAAAPAAETDQVPAGGDVAEASPDTHAPPAADALGARREPSSTSAPSPEAEDTQAEDLSGWAGAAPGGTFGGDAAAAATDNVAEGDDEGGDESVAESAEPGAEGSENAPARRSRRGRRGGRRRRSGNRSTAEEGEQSERSNRQPEDSGEDEKGGERQPPAESPPQPALPFGESTAVPPAIKSPENS